MLLNRSTSCWDRRSRLEKCPFVLSSFGLALALATIITIPCSYGQDNMPVCVTSGCVLIAAEYLGKANLSGDPCYDFYNFACGQYEANIGISENQSPFTDAKNELTKRLKDILESPPAEKENKAFGKTRTYYNACKNLTEINILKEKPLQDLLQQLGGWPAVEGEKWTSEREKNFEWTEAIYAMRKIGVSHNLLVDLTVGFNSINSSTYRIHVDKSALGMRNASYFLGGNNTANIVQEYLRLMINTAVLVGADRDTAEAELTSVLEFEIQLANLTLVQEANQSKHITLGDLQRIAPMVNWVEFANQLLMDKVDEKEIVNVHVSPKYLKQLTNLLMNTPKRTIANYLMWRVALSVRDRLDDRFIRIWLEFNAAVMGQTGDRSFYCLQTTKAYFPQALGAMYVRRYFNKDARDLAISLVSDVKEELQSLLSNEDWMDNITLGRALNKLKSMEEMVAYPLEFLNDTALEDFYINISVQENKYVSSSLQMQKIWNDYNYGKLRQFHDRHDWRNKPSVEEVYIYYNVAENSIMVPAGVLQGVAFGSDRPRYINYGAIGTAIGHEFTHGFDDQGRKYDEFGQIKSWGHPATDVQFTNKAKCMIDQYNRYKMTSVNMTVNGVYTLSENIADNGGLKAAYLAYRKWESDNYEEKTLPGLNFTTQQLFWMSFANLWCKKTTPRIDALTLLTDKFSPSIFRVNGVVSNSPEFSADFKCPVGSPMNPVEKCAVW